MIDLILSEEDDSSTDGATEPPPVAAAHLLSSRRRVEEAVAAALAELLPHSRRLIVTVDDPDNTELSRALQWAADSPTTPDEACAQMGVTVPEPDLPGWISAWPVSARSSRGGVTTFFATPATPPADLAVDLADWLQTTLADAWISDPTSPSTGVPTQRPARGPGAGRPERAHAGRWTPTPRPARPAWTSTGTYPTSPRRRGR
ncbi:hypothetical protein [Parafrankia sp. FMc2]|uniref:hypothetical protein n=1 Tax=Parafrankia sp. FMc2 TaxID=3233196 RepID=UPI0034D65896